MSRRAALEAGQRFGLLTLIEDLGVGPYGRHWLCRCDCGTETDALQSHIKKGATSSAKTFDWARASGALQNTISTRMKRGYSAAEAIASPAGRSREVDEVLLRRIVAEVARG